MSMFFRLCAAVFGQKTGRAAPPCARPENGAEKPDFLRAGIVFQRKLCYNFPVLYCISFRRIITRRKTEYEIEVQRKAAHPAGHAGRGAAADGLHAARVPQHRAAGNHVQRHSRRHRRDRARTCRWSHRRIRFRADQLSAVHRHRRPESARLDAVQHQPVFHDRAVLCPPHAGRLPARLYFPHRRPL